MSDRERTIELARRADELFLQVLVPTLVGGSLFPVRPIGPRLAREMTGIAHVFQATDSAAEAAATQARVRVARLLWPVDRLPPLGSDEWMMLAAFNDLLQVANPRLPSVVAPSRAVKLLDATSVLIERIGPPRSLAEAVCRHATFSRALDVVRVDTTVRWWTGSAVFRGEEPSRRLIAWPEVRRVRVEETFVPVDSLPLEGPVSRALYGQVLSRWLALSPLTDLGAAHREEPAFRWEAATLGLVSTPSGARLARRVLRAVGSPGNAALERATRALEQAGLKDAFDVATRFLEERRAHAALSP